MRDALSLTDQVLALGDGRITADGTREALGLVPEDEYLALLDLIAEQRAGDVFGAVCRPVSPSPPEANIVFVDGGGTVPGCAGPVDSTTITAPTNGTLGTLVDDADPFWDVCSQAHNSVAMTGRNVGDLLSDAAIPWGWFQGGFTLAADGTWIDASTSRR